MMRNDLLFRDKVVLGAIYKTEPWTSQGCLYFPFCLLSSLASNIIPSLHLNTQASLHYIREMEDKDRQEKKGNERSEGGRRGGAKG